MTKIHRRAESTLPRNDMRHGLCRTLRILVLPLACGLLAAPAVQAEKADRDKPVNLEADRVTVDETKQTATFDGNVVLTQGTLMIRGDRMIVQQDADGFKTGIATGNLASFRQKRDGLDEYVEGFAERIEYDSKADKVQMFNRAYLKKGLDEVRGNYISYDAASEFFRVTGGGKQAATPGNPDGRVRAIIQPKSRDKPAPNPPPLPLKPAAEMASPRDNPAGPAR
jgi:lipopolysaccharide export system protein LptA